jgi:hypothetical protein
LGWKFIPCRDDGFGRATGERWLDPDGDIGLTPPDFCGDLNAIHSAVLTLDNSHRTRFVIDSVKVVDSGDSYTFQHRFNLLTLGPREMSITFLRAVGKWRGEEPNP